MDAPRVFRCGNSQAVPLPKQFRLKTDEVEIFRRGIVRAFDLLAGLPDDLELGGRIEGCTAKNAQSCSGTSLSVRHEHLYLHSSEETG
jgi:antitoxin VapB